MQNTTDSTDSKASSPNWHALTVDETFALLESSTTGLAESVAKKRAQIYGANKLVTFVAPSLVLRFLRQFHNILIYILLCSGIIAIFFARWIDASVIFGVIVLSAIFGFIQEGKAEKALAAIRNMLAPSARVIRDGRKQVITATHLVPGDLVLIQRGDKVPADLRVIEAYGLMLEEAALTGESMPVEKASVAVAPNAGVSDRLSIAYSGTIVVSGKGTGVVVAIGSDTEIGKVSQLLGNVETPTTPLIAQMNRFGYWLTAAIIILGLLTCAVGVLAWGDVSEEMFMGIVALIVAAIPEGLPPILTIILAIGVTRMAKHNAIVRRLPAVETMGAVTTICTDKTGTLTCNELVAQDLVTAKEHYRVATDAIYLVDQQADLSAHHDLKTALLAGILCNDAEVTHAQASTKEDASIYGDAIDKALMLLGHKAKLNVQFEKQTYPREDLIPYESEHKFMATLHHDHVLGKGFICVKGAPELILRMCARETLNGETQPLRLAYWHEQINKLARLGERVVAIARKEVGIGERVLRFEDVSQLTMVGIFGFIDPPREEVASAVAQCRAAGIRVKMITGDHAATATAIARQVGIGESAAVLTGAEIDALSDAELAVRVLDVDVYVRTLPQHKLRLVRALQAAGQTVAMTGDGVNDAPALKQADIGIAMGGKGTEIAKEAADMVLADDNFTTIVHAVAEGRTIYENLQKTILYILPTSIGQAFAIVVAILLGWKTMPITAVQVLWINMLTTVTLSLAFGFEPQMSDVMQRPPRPKNEPILSLFLAWRVVFVSALMVCLVFAAFLLAPYFGVDGIAERRTIAVNAIVIGEVVYLFNCRRIYSSALNFVTLLTGKAVLIGVLAVLALQGLFTYAPIMQRFFGTARIGFAEWGWIVVASIAMFLLIEIEKWIMRRKKNGENP